MRPTPVDASRKNDYRHLAANGGDLAAPTCAKDYGRQKDYESQHQGVAGLNETNRETGVYESTPPCQPDLTNLDRQSGLDSDRVPRTERGGRVRGQRQTTQQGLMGRPFHQRGEE